MKRRMVATGLWAYFGWYLAAHLIAIFELPLGLAPLGGVAMAAMAIFDWRRLTYGLRGDDRRLSSS